MFVQIQSNNACGKINATIYDYSQIHLSVSCRRKARSSFLSEKKLCKLSFLIGQ